VEFNNFVLSPIANYKGKLYNLPFNMNTFYQIWNLKTPDEVMKKIYDQIKNLNIDNPTNLEEQALKTVGKDVFELLIKEYVEKQWNRSCEKLPPDIIKRLPVRFTFDNNYFNHRYQGIPIGGYNKIFDKMLDGIDVLLGTNYYVNKIFFDNIATKIVFTGPIDEYFGYKYGALEYRSLHFEHEVKDVKNYQGNAVFTFTSKNEPYTRVIEHKHFEFGEQDKTVITREFPKDWEVGDEPYYPINDEANNALYERYRAEAAIHSNLIFGGRLGEYKYFDMDQVIISALELVKRELE